MHNTETMTSLFLFGESYDVHYKQYEGTVIGILCPKVTVANDGTTISLSVNLGAQILVLGYSNG